ncbi:MAG: hypothetical protein QNK37_22705 [Acidobacteriota bacterium]|nr:hypothetical protein [Acidobacteriota bacterium]
MRLGLRLRQAVPFFLVLTVAFFLQAQPAVEPATNQSPLSEPHADPVSGQIVVYLKYGLYDQRRKVFRKSDFFNISRPRFYPRPGNRVRTVKKVPAYSSPEKRGALRLGELPTGTELVIERVLRHSRKGGFFGYKGHELWIEAHIAEEKLDDKRRK